MDLKAAAAFRIWCLCTKRLNPGTSRSLTSSCLGHKNNPCQSITAPILAKLLAQVKTVKGAVAPWRLLFLEVFLKSLSLFYCVPLYVCRLCINFQDLCARLLGVAALRILLLTFTSRFVIDFLSIRKVIIFSAIATDDRHPLRSRSIPPKCCKLHDDSFPLYCATEGGMENLLRTLT